MKKTKVLHIITHLGVGGAQDNTILTLEQHDRSQFEVHLVSSGSGDWRERAQLASDYFYECPHLTHPISPLKDLRSLLSLTRLIAKNKFDIIHTHSSKAGILGRWAAFISRTPHIVHTVHGFAFNDFMPSWKRNFYILIERLTSQITDFFITVSELNRNEAIALNLMNHQNSKTIYSGIDFSYLDATDEAESIRQSLNLDSNSPIVLMVGRLDEQKAPYLLIDAFAKVVEKCPQAKLLLVGEGQLRSRLEEQILKLQLGDQVMLLGSRTDVPNLIKISDVFALSSLWEGLGRAMTEAMLVGKPVVVPKIYGIPEIVHHNETGRLFPVKDTDEIASNLIDLIENESERKRLGKNAMQLTRQLFCANQMVEEIDSVYKKLLQDQSKPLVVGLQNQAKTT